MSHPIEIIPVLDLSGGKAVHARAGHRASYRPVVSRLLAEGDADPVRLAAQYRVVVGARRCYVADLDAIAGAPPDVALLGQLRGPGGFAAPLLVDAGVRSVEQADRVAATGNEIVAGLESLPDLALLSALADRCQFHFSLDLRNGEPVVPTGLRDDPRAASPLALARAAGEAGARSIIVLDLARVGTARGPDRELLARIRDAAHDAQLLAGGGVQGEEDLEALARLGVDGALVATALHDGRLPGARTQSRASDAV
jgi:phosphoribosylformimino-5-aminoimidazole carboxamide ribotide isomerase